MKLVSFDNRIIGETLAIPIYASKGLIYANKGTIISARILETMQTLGITSTYIEDNNDNIQVEEIIDVPKKFELVKELKEIYKECRISSKINDKAVIKIVKDILDNMNLSENAFLFNNMNYMDKDLYLYIHSIDVCILSLILGMQKKYDKKKLINLGIGALLHDIGKIFVDDRTHTRVGYEFIKNSNLFPLTSCLCIYQHHETEDGSGYPQSLKGDVIYEFSKVVGICNEYVNLLTSERCLLPNEVMEILSVEATSRFETSIYRDFLKSIYCYPNGLAVQLNNGELGIVVMQNKGFPTRPIIGVLKNNQPFLEDLTKNMTLFVERAIL